ncbi:MAG: UDP-N-acetylglucosamine 1-carboxyvinyltransferase [Candidatus Gastranaerophilales bacterium]|nr:UDP-N-acetylglucosamine 1-carboxyvinyltransferase [Candidatus Gastranaerophilales bacterium]
MSEKLIIKGQNQASGEVLISGAKNSVLKLMAASLLCSDVCTIYNVPELSDVEIMLDVLAELGAKTSYDKSKKKIVIDSTNLTNNTASKENVSKMRASFCVLGSLVGRLNSAKVALPGGCKIGERRVNFHIKGLETLGCECKIEDGYVIAQASELTGSSICFDIPSVGATENIMMASVTASGTTIIQNAAQEPEIVDLANFLKSMGANIEGAGTSQIIVHGVNQKDLKGCEYTTLPDRIEAGTYMSIIVASLGHGIIRNIFPNHLTLFTGKLLEMGANIKLIDPNTMEVSNNKRLKAMNFITQPYPGFPTDLQALAMALLSTCDGISVVTESLYENRFMHIPEFWRLGANIIVSKKHAIIKGVDFLVGTQVNSTDLRAGAALVTAAVMARGETEISGLQHIDRGYEHFVDKLRGLNIDAQRISENTENFCTIGDNRYEPRSTKV